jgi:hypothetical protein
MMKYKDTRHIALNLPKGPRGDRVQAAIFMLREEEDRSMGMVVLRIVEEYIGKQGEEFHNKVNLVQVQVDDLRGERGGNE